MYDVTKSYLPFATVISLVFFVAWSTRVVTLSQLDTEQKFHETARVVKELTAVTKEIAEAVSLRDTYKWFREDMVNWCERQQLKYPELTCPHSTGMPNRVNESQGNVNRAKRKLDAIVTDPALNLPEKK